jgi:hypothetical protein
MTVGIYQLALEKVMAEEMELKAEEMKVLVAKQRIIENWLSSILDGEVKSTITEEGTIEIDDVTFTVDHDVSNRDFVKAEIVCADCGEILNYKTIYNSDDIIEVYQSHKLCMDCLQKSCEVHHRSFWERLKDFLRGY